MEWKSKDFDKGKTIRQKCQTLHYSVETREWLIRNMASLYLDFEVFESDNIF